MYSFILVKVPKHLTGGTSYRKRCDRYSKTKVKKYMLRINRGQNGFRYKQCYNFDKYDSQTVAKENMILLIDMSDSS